MDQLAHIQSKIDAYRSLVHEYQKTLDRLKRELLQVHHKRPTYLKNIRYYDRDMKACIKSLADANDEMETFRQKENEPRFALLMMAFTPGKQSPVASIPVDIMRDMILLHYDTLPSERR